MAVIEAQTHSTHLPDGLPNPRRVFAFLTCALGITMAVLDGSIVNVALPTIAGEYHATDADAIWIVTAYQLAVVIALLPLGALGEAIGFRKVYTWGMLVFAIASLACAYSNSLLLLVLARILQGLSGAALMSMNGALIRFIMPTRIFGRGIALMAMAVAVASAAGPTIAGAILAIASWHWLFLINVPLGIIAFIAGRATLPASPLSGARFDFPSAVLNALTLGLLISGLASISSNGQIPPWMIVAQLAIAAIAGYFLVRRQLPRKAPMLPVDLLRIPAFRLSIMASLCSFCAQFLAFVSLPFFFSHALNFSEVQTGMLMTPWPAGTAIVGPIAGRLSDRLPAGKLSGIGSLLLAVGLVSMALLPATPSIWDIVWRMALCGMGFGLFQTPNNRVMFISAPRERGGGTSGMQSTARLLGQSVGAALAAIIFGLMAGYNLPLTMGLAAGFAFLAFIVSIWR